MANSILIGRPIRFENQLKEKQFLYTLVQDHSIWSNEQFWIEHFFYQHQRRLVDHYNRQSVREPVQTSSEQIKEGAKDHSEGAAKEIDSEDEAYFLISSESMDNTEVITGLKPRLTW